MEIVGLLGGVLWFGKLNNLKAYLVG